MVKAFELGDLEGLEVSSVCFVRDYVELHFDGPILRSLADPAIEVGGERLQFPQPGARDALCELISLTVILATEDSTRLVISLSNGAALVIPRASELPISEVAQLVPSIDGVLDVAGMLTWENLHSL